MPPGMGNNHTFKSSAVVATMANSEQTAKAAFNAFSLFLSVAQWSR